MQGMNVCALRTMASDPTPVIMKTAEEICAYTTVCAAG